MNTDNIGIEVDGDIIFVTVAKYKLFLQHGRIGNDAFLLYSHLMFTARLQRTNRVKANDFYLKKGLCWGKDRLINAKKLLFNLGLIKTMQTHRKDGKWEVPYIEVMTKTSPFEQNTIHENDNNDNENNENEYNGDLFTGHLKTGSPELDAKCLNKEYKCLNKELKNISKDILGVPSETPKENLKKENEKIKVLKETFSEEIKKCSEFVEYWNSKKGVTKHSPNKKTYDNLCFKFFLLKNGGFNKIFPVSKKYMDANHLSENDLNKTFSDFEIKESIDRFTDLLNGEYGPVFQNNLPKSCDSFLYNPITGSSIFFTKAGEGREPIQNRQVPLDQEAVALYEKAFFANANLDKLAKNELIKKVNFVVKQKREFEKFEEFFFSHEINASNFYRKHILYLTETFFDKGFFSMNKISSPGIWLNYVIWLKNIYDIELNPSKDELEKLKKAKEEFKKIEIDIEQDKKEKEEALERVKNNKNRFQSN